MASPWKWKVQGPGLSFTFLVNPNKGGTPSLQKKMNYQGTAAPGGKTLISEGRQDPPVITISGTLLSPQQLTSFLNWYTLRAQVQMTDDLGRTFWVYLTKFQADRSWKVSHPWHHEFSLEMIVVDWAVFPDILPEWVSGIPNPNEVFE